MRSKINITTTKKPITNPAFSFIIPAAGAGKRMRSIGPKSLIEINGTTLIENQIKIIKQIYPNSEIILVTGYESTRLMNILPESILKVENERFEDTNVVRSIGMGLRVAKGNAICVLYGDLFFNKFALPSYINESTLILDTPNGLMKEEEVGCTYLDGLVENLSFDLPQKWGQIAFFLNQELRLLKQLCWNPDKFNLYGFEIINEIINKKGKFKAVCPKDIKITDIDTIKDKERAEEIR